MLILWRRISRRRLLSAWAMSTPSTHTCPMVGSIRRGKQRSKVDLPLPERPITTKVSPGKTSNETSRTATMLPVVRSSSLDGNAFLGLASGFPAESCAASFFVSSFGCGPNTFQTLRQETTALASDVPFMRYIPVFTKSYLLPLKSRTNQPNIDKAFVE